MFSAVRSIPVSPANPPENGTLERNSVSERAGIHRPMTVNVEIRFAGSYRYDAIDSCRNAP